MKNSPYIIFLTGVSGAGKTTLLDKLSRKLTDPLIVYLHFDSIGVPSEDEMIQKYGSGSEWQKAMTQLWVKRIIQQYKNKKVVILEGQVNLALIVSAFEEVKITQYKIILAHCDIVTRHKRLHEDRNQPDLVNPTMDNWSNYLKKQAIEMDVPILDTTSMSIDEMVNWFKNYLCEFLNSTKLSENT